MEKEGKFLPIGTVVLLKGGKKELMITGYCIFPTGELYENGKKIDSTGKMYDYCACTYPEGIIRQDQIIGFNHDQIEKICYQGYKTTEHDGFNHMLKLSIDEMKREVTEINKEKESEAQA